MNRKFLIASSVIGLALGGCIIQQAPDKYGQGDDQDQPKREVHVYENWNGPGWYNGIYFRNEGRYRRWYNQRRQRHYSPAPKRSTTRRQRDQKQPNQRQKQGQRKRNQRQQVSPRGQVQMQQDQNQLAPQHQPKGRYLKP